MAQLLYEADSGHNKNKKNHMVDNRNYDADSNIGSISNIGVSLPRKQS